MRSAERTVFRLALGIAAAAAKQIGRARQGGHDIPAAARNLRYRGPTSKERRAGKMPALRVFGTDGRTEFAGDEGVQGAEPGGELGGGQTAVVVEPVEMTFRG